MEKIKDEKDYDIAFSGFIDGNEYDKAEDALYLLVSAAFKAGWLAAGGKKIDGQTNARKYFNSEFFLRKNIRVKTGE